MSRLASCRSGWLLFLAVLLTGCASLQDRREAQLQRVAKDWSQVIRASQVIPVYPLTQDMQPGDIFLVQTPVEDQVKVYRDRGFLPMDYLLNRLHLDYTGFYRGRDVGATADRLPQVGFPSYGFEVSSSQGVQLALPVSAVSAGLNFLGASAARGNISLRDAHTYGLDIDTLDARVRAEMQSNPAFANLVASFAAKPAGRWPWSKARINYLRVVNRVFLVRSVDVSLQATERNAAGLTASLQPGLSLGRYGATVNSLNRALLCSRQQPGRLLPDACRLADAVPDLSAAGGAVDAALTRVAPALATQALATAGMSVQTVTGNAISLREDFAAPVVVGYQGFDIPILADGQLGAPIPTYSLLDGQTVTATSLAVFTPDVVQRKGLEARLAKMSATQAGAVLERAVTQLGESSRQSWLADQRHAGKPLDAWRALIMRLDDVSEMQLLAALRRGCSDEGLTTACIGP